MNLVQPHETAEARPSERAAAAATREPAADRPGAVLVPFPVPGARRTRRSPLSGERRGEILFFLGVRYERLEHDAEQWNPVCRNHPAITRL